MQINSIMLIVLLFLAVFLILTVFMWPAIALGLFMAIPLVKLDLYLRLPFLKGWIGYLFDTSLVVIAILSIVIYNIKKGERIKIYLPKSFWLCWLVMCALVWVRLPASRDFDSGVQRAILFSVFNTLVLIMGALYGSNPKSVSKIITAFMGVGIVCTFGLLFFGSPSDDFDSARMSIANAAALSIGDYIAYMIMVIMAFWLSKRKYLFRKFSFILIGFALLAILLAGHRGAVLGLTVTILFTAMAYRRMHGIWTIMGGVVLLLFIGGVVNYFFKTAAQAERFSVGQINEAITGRVDMIKNTVKEWSRSPVLGRGTGDTSYQLTNNTGERKYPHNIYLEVLNEFGIVGFIFYMGLFLYTIPVFKASLSYQESDFVPRDYLVILAAGLIFHILFGVKTGSYSGSVMLYFFMGAGISLTKFSRQTGSQEIESDNYEAESN
jgi:O-antigen ligase